MIPLRKGLGKRSATILHKCDFLCRKISRKSVKFLNFDHRIPSCTRSRYDFDTISYYRKTSSAFTCLSQTLGYCDDRDRDQNRRIGSLQFLPTPISQKKFLDIHSKTGLSVAMNRNISAASIVNACPERIQPYLRLIRFDRPIGTWLLYLPCTWSITMATDPGCMVNVKLLALFGVGALVMRGAGCTINDMWDFDLDQKVARTSTRPIASGQLNHFQALLFLGGQLSCGLAILLSLNTYSIILGASSMGLVVTYPLMKRITHWPQIVLGLAMNWGVLVGWAAVKGSCDWSVCLPLYMAGFFWTMMYDTIYAHQDKSDDIAIGVKSTAILFGDRTKSWLSAFSAGMVASLAIAGITANQSWPYFAGVGLTAIHLAWQTITVDLDNPQDCLEKFKSNKWLGVLIFGAILSGVALETTKNNSQEKNNDENDGNKNNSCLIDINKSK